MKRLAVAVAVAALAAMAFSLPLFAADPLPWPWKAKTPPDPALTQLTRVDDLAVAIDKSDPPIVSITVKATAPTAGYSELQLTYRLGDPNDLKFEFDARGRAPQEASAQVLAPVSIEAAYSGAPIAKVKVVEVYAKENCMGYSVQDGKAVECAPKPPAE
jgi:hypothetical protein